MIYIVIARRAFTWIWDTQKSVLTRRFIFIFGAWNFIHNKLSYSMLSIVVCDYCRWNGKKSPAPFITGSILVLHETSCKRWRQQRFLYILTFLAEIAVLDRNNELLWVKGMAEVSYRSSNSENPIQHEQRSHLLEIHNLLQPVSVCFIAMSCIPDYLTVTFSKRRKISKLSSVYSMINYSSTESSIILFSVAFFLLSFFLLLLFEIDNTDRFLDFLSGRVL